VNKLSGGNSEKALHSNSLSLVNIKQWKSIRQTTKANIGLHQWLGLGLIGKLISQNFFFFKAFFL